MVARLIRSPVIYCLVLAACAIASVVMVDRINPSARSDATGAERVDTTRASRVLVLIIDSWRYQSAIDPVRMPTVARLRSAGASGRIETVFEGFTIPALQAAFSGRAETQLINAFRNFHFRALAIESAFLDATRASKRSIVIGGPEFDQFGPVLEKRFPVAPQLDMYGVDHLSPGMALDAYLARSADLVVCHYESVDWTAHETGIHSLRYDAAFRGADSVVARFAAARRPQDYLIVFGDHGHNEAGEHKTGLDIPTFGVFIGPDIRAGATFDLPIRNLRFVIDHGLGIDLNPAPYDVRELSRFLPIAQSAANASAGASGRDTALGVSRRPTDYLWFAVLLLVFAGLAGTAGGKMESVHLTSAGAVVVLAFVAELVAQEVWNATWSLFPLVLVGLGGLVWHRGKGLWSAVVLVATGVFFLTRLRLDAGSAAPRAPVGIGALIPLYVVGVGAKLWVLTRVTGRRRWYVGVAAAAVLSVLEFRVWDAPGVIIAAVVIALVSVLASRDVATRRLALLSFGYAALYCTLRLPLYQLVWVDLFLFSVWLVRHDYTGPWLDALIISGAFTLTCLWLPGGLEWGFLYRSAPAYIVELHVGWFLPLILLKLPLMLLLAWWVADTQPTREGVTLMLVYMGIRFIGAWVFRLLGASSATIWPMAEYGVYLLTFAVATVWLYRLTPPRGTPASVAC